jgi:hypothetical protein
LRYNPRHSGREGLDLFQDKTHETKKEDGGREKENARGEYSRVFLRGGCFLPRRPGNDANP